MNRTVPLHQLIQCRAPPARRLRYFARLRRGRQRPACVSQRRCGLSVLSCSSILGTLILGTFQGRGPRCLTGRITDRFPTPSPDQGSAVPANLDKPYRWKKDIARSVDAFNRWFLENAPLAFQEQRSRVTADVCQAMAWTKCFTRISREILKTHPNVLPVLRMATCPPLARDRVVGLAGVGRNLVFRMEKGSIPPRMSEKRLDRDLSRCHCR